MSIKKYVSLNGLSSIETIHKVSQKVFDNYARLIVQFNKNQNIGNNYLYIDIEMEMKSGVSYPAQLQTHILCYGVKGLQSDIPSSLYDALWTIDNGKIKMNEVIDMGNKPIIGIKDGLVASGAVNYKQLNTLERALLDMIDENNNLIYENKKQTRTYYEEIFDYYFDCLNPENFNVDQTSSGAILEKINDKLVTSGKRINVKIFDPKNGIPLFGAEIRLDESYNQNSNFTMFIVLKHNDNNENNNLSFGVEQYGSIIMSPQFLRVKYNTFHLQESESLSVSKTITSAYKGKQLMFWFSKNDNFYSVKLCENGGMASKTISNRLPFNDNTIYMLMDYKILRVGFSSTFYSAESPEFHKIVFLEKSKGTFFQ